MFSKNSRFFGARVVLVFMLIVGVLGIMPEQVSAAAVSGTISGTVYKAGSKTPIPNIFIYAIGDNVWQGTTCTDASGMYTLSNLPLGMDLRVGASPDGTACGQWSNYIEEFWPEQNMYQNASVITLTAKQSVKRNTNFTLDLGGQISGTTYASDGVTRLPHIAIALNNDQTGLGVGSICSDELGNYTYHGVPLNLALRIRADAYQDAWCNAGGSYNSEYYGETLNDGPTLVTLAQADEQRAGIDFRMSAVGAEAVANVIFWYKDGILELNYDTLPEYTHLKLKIEDYNTPQSPDFSAETDVASNGHASFNMGQFKVVPGMYAYVSGAYRTYIIHVRPLEVTSVDPATDTVTGTAPADDWMWLYFEPSCCRPAVADANGNWMVDYSVPGPNSEPIADIVPGSEGAVQDPSGDGSTAVHWIAATILTLNSVATNDGWVLESAEGSNIGGTLNNTASTFDVGDDKANKQYIGILDFDTSSLPDTAVITSVTLKVQQKGITGTNPFTALGNLLVDIQEPYFGSTAGLETGDFQATSGRSEAASFGPVPAANWYSATVDAAGYPYVNLTGTTQFRLRFALDDNDNKRADNVTFYSGDAASANRPQLIIQYYLP